MSDLSRKCCLVLDKLLLKNKNKLEILHFRPCGKKFLFAGGTSEAWARIDGLMEAQQPSGVSPFDKGTRSDIPTLHPLVKDPSHI